MASKKIIPRRMNADERIAQLAFKQKGFEDVVFEPDGNIPPDFLLDGRIAVEVRRLNQCIEKNGKIRGQDEILQPFWDGMHKLLGEMGQSVNESWFVAFTYQHPVGRWATYKPAIKKALLEFKDCTDRKNSVVFETENFAVDVFKATAVHPDFFIPGCIQDLDCGGAIVAEVIRNAEICSTEKLEKIAKHRLKYPEWWLLLVNQFGFKLDDLDKQQLHAHFKCPEGWDKLVIVNVAPDDWIEFLDR